MAKIDIQRFRQRAYRKKKSLVKFLRSFKKKKVPGILAINQTLEKEVWKEINCLDCANCCKTMTPTYTKKDIYRIAKHFKMSYAQFYDKWLTLDDNKDIVNQSTPCQFLGKDNKCSIYAIRPFDCSGFPHFHRRDFQYQAAEGVFAGNLHRCPATLAFVEKLKDKIEADFPSR